jgi:hypothetical protein
MHLCKINTEADFLQFVRNADFNRKKPCKKVRVFENGKSYEDYSISYTLDGKPILNYAVSVEHGFIIVKKKARKATRHIRFEEGSMAEIYRVDKKVPYIAVNVLSEVRYTDGTHRYER